MNKEEIKRNLENYILQTNGKTYLTFETNTNLMARDCLNTIEQLISQLDIANNKLKEVKEHCENQVNDYNNYADRRCVDERDYGIYLNSQKILSIIGSD